MSQTAIAQADWGGGASPFGVTWQKMMMWFFIVTDALLFAGLLVSYGVVRIATGDWPAQSEVFSLTYIAAMTFVLITSSATMACGVKAAELGRSARAAQFVWLTILGGFIFLGMQAYEWSVFIHEGGGITGNPWGSPTFSQFFFIITGFHGFHVLTGVTVLLVVAIRAAMGRYSPAGVENAGLYWHFVDLVWVFVFALFYLV
ncbi:MAG: cytochrome c oxidase subunit 3 [Acidobacteria bacterium]|nr:cytochrome c oxidase subunit 3 [Acidobacteriota bacterium]